MTDDARLPDPLAAARALPRGSLVIVRARDSAKRARLLASLKPIARIRNLKLLIADDPMLAARADGLHLPEIRAHESIHWRALHPRWIITAAAHAFSVRARDMDAILLSPIFPTESHPAAAHLGAARARMMAARACTPVYALGGINAKNVARLRSFIGVAAISALS
jgi:thiamine-phosphate pyrophosphorylase